MYDAITIFCAKSQNRSFLFSQNCGKMEEIEFDKRNTDVKDLRGIFSIFIGPFTFVFANAVTFVQQELIDFRNDSDLKDKYLEERIHKIYS